MQKYHRIFLVGVFLSFAGCDAPPQEGGALPTRHFTNAIEKEYADKQFAVYDPAESVNKQIYKFNAELDAYILLPVVDAYIFVTPEFARARVSDFFQNVSEVTNFINSVLQLSPQKAGITLGRFVINTTAGLLGTFDVATEWELVRQPEDFGKTLGHWGAGNGPYIVLPVLGPSNLRDTVGQVVDYATLAVIIPHSVKETTAYDVVAYGLEPLNLRYGNSFRYYSSGSPFEYELVRYIVTQARTAEIEKGRGH